MPTNSAQCYPYHANLSPILARRIIEDCQQQLPILDNIIILMPNYHASTQLREELTAQAHQLGFGALLGPQIYTLKDYIEKNTLLNTHRIPANSRELILMQALEDHKHLFGEQSLLTIAESLLELFDELTRHQIALPEDIDDFIQQMMAAYQCSETQMTALSKEATIVHTLWQAWHAQLSEDNISDLETHYQLKLSNNLQQGDDCFFYIAGYYEFLPSELQWVSSKISEGLAALFFHGQSFHGQTFHGQTSQGNFSHKDDTHQLHPSNTLHSLFSTLDLLPDMQAHEHEACFFIDAVYESSGEQFNDRANAIKKQISVSPILNKIYTFEGNSFEEEARAIEVQIRAWMANNIKHIALIIEDRMLARRVRALLEQSGIGLKDMEGWALSTSSAASIVESWLQTIEENFHHLPFLDVIKSPFSLDNINIDAETIYRFEQDIIQHENISQDLNRYRKACIHRQHRLNIYNPKNADSIVTLLTHIEKAAKPLIASFKTTQPLSVFLSSLTESLDLLGCTENLEQDIAGEQLIKLFSALKENVAICDIEMGWLGFRHWLGKKLEETTFKPASDHKYYVELLHLTQSSLGHYEALIIGSMTQDSFPGAAKQTPFFNQSVRAELNLPSPVVQLQTKFYHFRRLLESAPNVLLTMHTGPQENLVSPWLSLLKNFHQLAYGCSLENTALRSWVAQYQISEKKSVTAADKAIINETRLPQSISASGHQALINCPYSFFAAQVLRLRAPDSIRDTLAKSDYGERVHLCLQAFHAGDVDRISGPFTQAVTSKNRNTAIALLQRITDEVFSQDIEDNFQHRGWVKRWAEQIPKYIDWEIARAQRWTFKSGEFAATQTLPNGLTLNGRIDRMDRSSKNLAVIDYKTGSIPKMTDVENGEAVQLPHYALASENDVSHIEYLLLEDGPSKKVSSKCELEDEALTDIKEQTRVRLLTMYQGMAEGQSLEAWGTENSCQFCQFKGLCRTQFS